MQQEKKYTLLPVTNPEWVKGQYDQLYDQAKRGKRTVCYVDYDRDLGIRDVCDIDPANMCFGVRGRGYGDPDYYSGMEEKEAFIMICENINVEWLKEFDWSKISREQDLADGKELTAYYAEIERKESNEQPVEQKLPNDVVEKLLKVRDYIAIGEYDEAYHHLYHIADPEFVSFFPWKEFEEQVGYKKLNEVQLKENKQSGEQKENEAVAFAEWLSLNYDIYGIGFWRPNEVTIDDPVYNTEQLYNEYQKQKK